MTSVTSVIASSLLVPDFSRSDGSGKNMKSLCNTILLAVLFAGALQSQTSKQDRQGSPTGSNSSNPASSVSVHEYREILQNERKLLDDQSEKYYVRIDALIDRTLWVIGVICMIA